MKDTRTIFAAGLIALGLGVFSQPAVSQMPTEGGSIQDCLMNGGHLTTYSTGQIYCEPGYGPGPHLPDPFG